MHDLAPMIMLISFFISIAVVIIALSNNRLKKKMIELGHVDEDAIKLVGQSFKFKFNALKWGLILFFGGLGLVVISFLPYDFQRDTPLPFGVELMFIAAGFLIYYFTIRNKKDSISE